MQRKLVYTIIVVTLFMSFESGLFAQTGDVVINEIMYAPTGTPNSQEWFEIYNKSSTAYDLKNWKWKDSSGVLRTITTSSILLNPNSYSVVCQDSASVKSFYSGFSGLIFQTTWNALNNGQDSVVLVDSLGTRIDFVAYRSGWGGSAGNRSLERILPGGQSNQQSNWGTSIAVIGATPNLRNSITAYNNDLSLNLISFSNPAPLIGSNVTVTVNVKNRGQLTASNFVAQLFLDYNRDSIPISSELLSSQNSTGSLNTGDSVNFFFSFVADSLGVRQFVAKVNYAPDEDTSNNKKINSINVLSSGGFDSIVVNEIMYAPTTNTGKEWFEIYNKSSNSVNLNGWKWKDATTSINTITNQNISIQPGGFAVICEDSNAVKSFYPNNPGTYIQSLTWSALNNTSDENVILINSFNSRIDSVTFNSSWGGSSGNKSLERIFTTAPSNQQSNWGTCADPIGASPNKINSLTPKPNDLALNKITFNKTTPALGDTLGILAQVKNNGLNPASNYTLKFYDDYNKDSIATSNELITTLNSIGTLNSGDSLDFIFTDVLDSAGLRQYISVVTYNVDNDTNNNKKVAGINVLGGSTAGRVLVNEIMYDFPTGECEWVEIYNNSDSIVNLKNWKIQDNGTTQVIITSNDYFLNPLGYVVISQSNAIFTKHVNIDSGKVIINSSLPLLNNDGDAVIIYKINGALSDRVDYKSSWGGSESSLERISVNQSSDSTNFATSIDCEKSSPTRVNAISTAVQYQFKDLVVNEIMAAPLSDTNFSTAEWFELYNPTNSAINLTGWKFYETSTTKNISDTCSAQVKPGMYVVVAEDSSIFRTYSYLRTVDSTRKIIILNSSLGLNNDQDLVKVADVFKTMIDSVHYFDSWYNPNIPATSGVSLERINPSLPSNDNTSWSSCAFSNGGTPGMRNSIYTVSPNTNAQITIFPNPFSPDNDGFEDFTIISYRLTQTISQVRLKIFDVKGRLIRTVLNNQTSGSSGQIVFDGLDDEKRKLRLGIYVVFFEALNDQNGVVEQIKTTVVVAAKL